MKIRGMWATLSMVMGLCLSAASSAGVQELVRETQRTAESGGQVSLVWWMPLQFWEESMKANAGMPEAARNTVLNALTDYTVIAMMRGKAGLGGFSEVQSRDDLVKNARVEFNGTVLEPLQQDKITPVAQLLLAQLKPALAGMVGPVGSAMEFIVYPAKSAEDKLLVDAMQSGTLKVKFYENDFSWRLPLGSLLPARVDKKTGEEFPGSYQFNPYTGDKLTLK